MSNQHNNQTKSDITAKCLLPYVSGEDRKLVINNLKSNRSLGGETILKECEFTFCVPAEFRNKSIEAGAFRDCMEEANVILFLERAIRFLRRTIAQLVHFNWSFQISEISSHRENIFSSKHYGFRKVPSTQHDLFELLC